MSPTTNQLATLLLAGVLAICTAFVSDEAAAQSQRLELEINEGQVIRLPRSAKNVFIGNPKVADITVMSPRIMYVFGVGVGSTTFYAIDGNERIMTKREVIVGHNLGRLREELNQLSPGGNINAISVNSGIILTGKVPTERASEDARLIATRFLGDSQEVVNRLEIVEPNQVTIRVRIAEVAKEVVEQLNLSWENFFENGDVLFGIATGNPVKFGSLAGVLNVAPPVDIGVPDFITRSGTEVNSIYGGGRIGDLDINGVIDILEQDNLVTILAEPSLTAVSGETASFLAGGEFPIPVSQDEDSITIEFKEFGVSLSFTPTVLTPERISLLIRPEVSELSNEGAIQLNNLIIPALRVRRAETTVELGSGQSFALAGLLRENTIYSLEKTPGLADIPILGALFTSKRFERDETELAIIATPYVVRPSNTQLAVPSDAYMRYRTASPTVRRPAQVSGTTVPLRPSVGIAGRPSSSAGFILE